MEGAGFKSTIKKFNGGQEAWVSFLKPTLSTLTPVIGKAVVAKNKIPQVGQAITSFLKSISEGKTFIRNRYARSGFRTKSFIILIQIKLFYQLKEEDLKRCSSCSNEKLLTHLFKKSKSKDSLYDECKSCRKQYDIKKVVKN